MLNALHKHDAGSVRLNEVIVRELRTVRREYRRTLAALMGLAGARRYRALRSEMADAPRAQKLRASRALLDSIGFNRERADRLRKQYTAATSKLLRLRDVHIPPGGIIVDDRCSPDVTYTAPYAGFFWGFSWHRSDEASDPVLTRYLDMATGECGSAIETRLSGADDDDEVAVDFTTALGVRHTARQPARSRATWRSSQQLNLLGHRQRRMGFLRRNVQPARARQLSRAEHRRRDRSVRDADLQLHRHRLGRRRVMEQLRLDAARHSL